MPTGPKGEKRPANVVANAVHMMRVTAGQAEETYVDAAKAKAGRAGGKAKAGTVSLIATTRSPKRARLLVGRVS